MNTYISILRGINVNGQKSLKMEMLKQLYIELGFSNVETYIQSGNIIFQYKEAEIDILEAIITNKIAETFKFNVLVIVKKYTDFKDILDQNPFLKEKDKNAADLYITFLSDTPTQDDINRIKVGNYQKDLMFISDKAIYLYCPDGYGKTKLTNTFFEAKLKVVATTRNHKTAAQLIEIADKLIKIPK